MQHTCSRHAAWDPHTGSAQFRDLGSYILKQRSFFLAGAVGAPEEAPTDAEAGAPPEEAPPEAGAGGPPEEAPTEAHDLACACAARVSPWVVAAHRQDQV